MGRFRNLSIELLDCLEKADWPPKYKDLFEKWTRIARREIAAAEDVAMRQFLLERMTQAQPQTNRSPHT